MTEKSRKEIIEFVLESAMDAEQTWMVEACDRLLAAGNAGLDVRDLDDWKTVKNFYDDFDFDA